MGNTDGYSRGILSLILVLGMSACAPADAQGKKPFDIPAQPAALALNEFAKQADITLIFSYDLVAAERTRPLQGSFAVSDGLTRLLHGTPLGYRQGVDGAYLICPLASCGIAPPAAPERPDPVGRQSNARDSGNPSLVRLQVEPAPVPGI